MSRGITARIARPLQAAAIALALLGPSLPGAGRPTGPTAHAQQAGHVEVVDVVAGRAAPGQTVTLRGAGWEPGDILTARLCETADPIGVCAALTAPFQVDDGGAFAVTDTVPRTLFGSTAGGAVPRVYVVPGAYTVIVSGGPRVMVTTPLTVGAPPGSALVWGQAAFDRDGNGRRDPDDAPAQVDVAIAEAAPDSRPWRVSTDSRGRYVQWPVLPGLYTIQSEAEEGAVPWAAAALVPIQVDEAARIDLLLRPAGQFAAAPRCFPETGFCVEQDAFWAHFTALGGAATFGYPISRTFPFLGCAVQFFQRHVLQQCRAAGPTHAMNLLDPDLVAYRQINGSTFPAHDPQLAAAAPPPETPDYAGAVLAHLRATVPDTFEGVPVGFFSAFVGTVPGLDWARNPGAAAVANLQIWGFPTSRPTFDPTNHNFVYQRFQRGILHHDAATGQTQGILLADWFMRLITGRDLPADLATQAAGSRFLGQYCSEKPAWLCRPAGLAGTNLSAAFEPQA